MKLIKIHQDRRGEIVLLEGLVKENKEVSIFTTKEGYSRGGCIHKKNLEHFTVIEGQVKLFIDKQVVVLVAGESTFIPKGASHYFVALEDSITIEWGATKSEKKNKDKNYRQIVDRINNEKNS